MLPVSPIRTVTRLDRIQSRDLYKAIDFSGPRPRYLHMNGLALTEDKFWAWTGTLRNFRNICTQNEWDALEAVPVDRLKF
ncbi:hypothetical protein HYO99_gp41 [Roseobacter phage RD-1410W1-01]|uniref:Uncharacterized protein n=1 Tax=Roseobacter phage RD-1410W1-01 TaxID=1815984 RepID=A0A191VYI8_9CAUD|nr:hypothetical protein HYO99_gp41 [Roseobacter phage RD-1410W1-01]ANJ20775.1 hypothetical protein RDp01_gp41 [Roseobacter phage RD-1410W1-01]